MYSRRYKSKSQRPCDFCRKRRAACRIISTPPCELCKSHSHQCTFAHSPPPRKKPSPAAPMEMDDEHLQLHTTSEAGAASHPSPGVAAGMLEDAWAVTSYLSQGIGDISPPALGSSLISGELTEYEVGEDLHLRLGEELTHGTNATLDHHVQPGGPGQTTASSNGSGQQLLGHNHSVLGATDPSMSWRKPVNRDQG